MTIGGCLLTNTFGFGVVGAAGGAGVLHAGGAGVAGAGELHGEDGGAGVAQPHCACTRPYFELKLDEIFNLKK